MLQLTFNPLPVINIEIPKVDPHFKAYNYSHSLEREAFEKGEIEMTMPLSRSQQQFVLPDYSNGDYEEDDVSY